MTDPVAQPLSAADLAPARRGGPRVSTFDNGRQERYESVFVQHPGGEWDRILIARDDGRIAALLVGLINAAARSVPDYPMLAKLHRHQYDLRCRLCGQDGQVRVSVEPEGEDPR